MKVLFVLFFATLATGLRIQHLDLARLRTIDAAKVTEVKAGITTAIEQLKNTLALLGDDTTATAETTGSNEGDDTTATADTTGSNEGSNEGSNTGETTKTAEGSTSGETSTAPTAPTATPKTPEEACQAAVLALKDHGTADAAKAAFEGDANANVRKFIDMIVAASGGTALSQKQRKSICTGVTPETTELTIAQGETEAEKAARKAAHMAQNEASKGSNEGSNEGSDEGSGEEEEASGAPFVAEGGPVDVPQMCTKVVDAMKSGTGKINGITCTKEKYCAALWTKLEPKSETSREELDAWCKTLITQGDGAIRELKADEDVELCCCTCNPGTVHVRRLAKGGACKCDGDLCGRVGLSKFARKAAVQTVKGNFECPA